MAEEFILSKIPERYKLAYYGLLFSMAHADKDIARDEIELILKTLDMDGMSEEAKQKIYDYLLNPPNYKDCLDELAGADDEIKYGSMMQITDIAWADEILEPSEQEIIDKAQVVFDISDEQRSAIQAFVDKVREIRRRGIDDSYAAKTLKSALSGLGAVGVPITAVYFSGSVIGLSASGISSGLAAVGLGLGMVPGIGIAVLLGTATFFSIKKLANLQIENKKKRQKQESSAKIVLMIRNMQDYVRNLMDQFADYRITKEGQAYDQRTLDQIYARLIALRQLFSEHGKIT